MIIYQQQLKYDEAMVWEYIVSFYEDRGTVPTLQEISTAIYQKLGWKKNTRQGAWVIVKKLEEKGFLFHLGHHKRNIRIKPYGFKKVSGQFGKSSTSNRNV